MEKVSIQYHPKVEHYLNQLVDVLFSKNYFSYEESASAYVLNIIDAIENNIHTQQHKQTPKELATHGRFYISYKATKRTTWYIFFDRKDDRYLIKYITNNHVAAATFLKHF